MQVFTVFEKQESGIFGVSSVVQPYLLKLPPCRTSTPWHQIERDIIRKGLAFLLKMHKLGVFFNWGAMEAFFNWGDPNIAKLLQLVVNIVVYVLIFSKTSKSLGQ